MAHQTTNFDPNKEFYSFQGGIKKMSLIFIALGILGSLWAFFDNHGVNHHSRFWSNFLLNTYYFNGMAITAIFFVAAHTIGYGGWFVALKRVFESFGAFIWIGFIFFGIIILGLWFDWHNLYHHWTHAPATDTIVGDKKAFLNKKMFTFLSLVFFSAWIVFSKWLRSHSLSSDSYTNEIAYNQKSKYISAAYIVGFGVGSSVFSWLAVMSLDPHWYSTLFGWYNFASYMCGFLAMVILIITYLRAKGLLAFVNESHMHNIVLFLFGFSVFYTYLWFSQFMLIWYGNIPEDTMYFYKRFNVPLFNVLFYVTFIINFIFPFLFLIRRNAKRNPWIYAIVASILLFGHYLDFYLMVMFEPNAPMHEEVSHHASAKNFKSVLYAENKTGVSESNLDSKDEQVIESTESNSDITNAHKNLHSDSKLESSHVNNHHEDNAHFANLGIIELMIFLGFIGLFIYSSLHTLSKERLVPIKSPFLDESLRYHT